MKFRPPQTLAMITALTVFSYTTMPAHAAAADPHVVNLSDLQREIGLSQQARAKNLQDIERVLSLPAAQDALAKANLNMARVKGAMTELNDQELARLADRARAAEKDVEGGFIVGILALIGLIVVVIVVLAVIKAND